MITTILIVVAVISAAASIYFGVKLSKSEKDSTAWKGNLIGLAAFGCIAAIAIVGALLWMMLSGMDIVAGSGSESTTTAPEIPVQEDYLRDGLHDPNQPPLNLPPQ